MSFLLDEISPPSLMYGSSGYRFFIYKDFLRIEISTHPPPPAPVRELFQSIQRDWFTFFILHTIRGVLSPATLQKRFGSWAGSDQSTGEFLGHQSSFASRFITSSIGTDPHHQHHHLRRLTGYSVKEHAIHQPHSVTKVSSNMSELLKKFYSNLLVIESEVQHSK